MGLVRANAGTGDSPYGTNLNAVSGRPEANKTEMEIEDEGIADAHRKKVEEATAKRVKEQKPETRTEQPPKPPGAPKA
jgi:hypothetical protein